MPSTITPFFDQTGRKVLLPHFPPRHLISLVPSQTELLFDLGAGQRIAAITEYCIHPAKECTSKPRIGGPKSVDFAKIKAIRPDLIIANTEENDRKQIEQLAHHYPVWCSDIVNLGQALEMIRGVGALTGTAEKAEQIAAEITASLTPPPHVIASCAYLIWDNPLMVAGDDTFINEMLGYLGVRNLFADRKRYPAISEDDIHKANPDLLLLSSEPYPFNESSIPHCQQRFPKQRIITVDGEIFSWYGSRLLQAAPYFTKLRRQIGPVL